MSVLEAKEYLMLHILLLLWNTKKMKKQFFQKYIKTTKKSPSKDIVEQISKYYECSLGEAEEYTYILGNKGIQEILNKLGYESK